MIYTSQNTPLEGISIQRVKATILSEDLCKLFYSHLNIKFNDYICAILDSNIDHSKEVSTDYR